MTYQELVGTRMRYLRMERHWQQKDLAARAGWSRSDLSRFEMGQWRLVDLQKIVRLAAVLSVSLDRLLSPVDDLGEYCPADVALA